jgi:hypothetical protein
MDETKSGAAEIESLNDAEQEKVQGNNLSEGDVSPELRKAEARAL